MTARCRGAVGQDGYLFPMRCGASVFITTRRECFGGRQRISRGSRQERGIRRRLCAYLSRAERISLRVGASLCSSIAAAGDCRVPRAQVHLFNCQGALARLGAQAHVWLNYVTGRCGAQTQNSLPTGSSMTANVLVKPCETSSKYRTFVAPSDVTRSISAASLSRCST